MGIVSPVKHNTVSTPKQPSNNKPATVVKTSTSNVEKSTNEKIRSAKYSLQNNYYTADNKKIYAAKQQLQNNQHTSEGQNINKAKYMLENNYHTVENRQAYREQYAQESGYKTPEPAGRGIMDRIFGMLGVNNVPQVLYNLTDGDKSTGILDGIGQSLAYWSPFTDDVSGRKYWSDVLENIGWKDKPNGKLNVGRGVTGFALDVLTDPLTYVYGLGAGSKVVKGTGVTLDAAKSIRAAAKAASVAGKLDDAAKGVVRAERIAKLNPISLDDARNIVRDSIFSTENSHGLLKSMTPEKVTKYIDDQAQLLHRSYTQKVQKLRDLDQGEGLSVGLNYLPFSSKIKVGDKTLDTFKKTFISSEKLREFGDKTIAPYYNTLAKKIRTSRLGQLFSRFNRLEKVADTEGHLYAAKLFQLSEMAKGKSKFVLNMNDYNVAAEIGMFFKENPDVQMDFINAYEKGIFHDLFALERDKLAIREAALKKATKRGGFVGDNIRTHTYKPKTKKVPRDPSFEGVNTSPSRFVDGVDVDSIADYYDDMARGMPSSGKRIIHMPSRPAHITSKDPFKRSAQLREQIDAMEKSYKEIYKTAKMSYYKQNKLRNLGESIDNVTNKISNIVNRLMKDSEVGEATEYVEDIAGRATRHIAKTERNIDAYLNTPEMKDIYSRVKQSAAASGRIVEPDEFREQFIDGLVKSADSFKTNGRDHKNLADRFFLQYGEPTDWAKDSSINPHKLVQEYLDDMELSRAERTSLSSKSVDESTDVIDDASGAANEYTKANSRLDQIYVDKIYKDIAEAYNLNDPKLADELRDAFSTPIKNANKANGAVPIAMKRKVMHTFLKRLPFIEAGYVNARTGFSHLIIDPNLFRINDMELTNLIGAYSSESWEDFFTLLDKLMNKMDLGSYKNSWYKAAQDNLARYKSKGFVSAVNRDRYTKTKTYTEIQKFLQECKLIYDTGKTRRYLAPGSLYSPDKTKIPRIYKNIKVTDDGIRFSIDSDFPLNGTNYVSGDKLVSMDRKSLQSIWERPDGTRFVEPTDPEDIIPSKKYNYVSEDAKESYPLNRLREDEYDAYLASHVDKGDYDEYLAARENYRDKLEELTSTPEGVDKEKLNEFLSKNTYYDSYDSWINHKDKNLVVEGAVVDHCSLDELKEIDRKYSTWKRHLYSLRKDNNAKLTDLTSDEFNQFMNYVDCLEDSRFGLAHSSWNRVYNDPPELGTFLSPYKHERQVIRYEEASHISEKHLKAWNKLDSAKRMGYVEKVPIYDSMSYYVVAPRKRVRPSVIDSERIKNNTIPLHGFREILPQRATADADSKLLEYGCVDFLNFINQEATRVGKSTGTIPAWLNKVLNTIDSYFMDKKKDSWFADMYADRYHHQFLHAFLTLEDKVGFDDMYKALRAFRGHNAEKFYIKLDEAFNSIAFGDIFIRDVPDDIVNEMIGKQLAPLYKEFGKEFVDDAFKRKYMCLPTSIQIKKTVFYSNNPSEYKSLFIDKPKNLSKIDEIFDDVETPTPVDPDALFDAGKRLGFYKSEIKRAEDAIERVKGRLGNTKLSPEDKKELLKELKKNQSQLKRYEKFRDDVEKGAKEFADKAKLSDSSYQTAVRYLEDMNRIISRPIADEVAAVAPKEMSKVLINVNSLLDECADYITPDDITKMCKELRDSGVKYADDLADDLAYEARHISPGLSDETRDATSRLNNFNDSEFITPEDIANATNPKDVSLKRAMNQFEAWDSGMAKLADEVEDATKYRAKPEDNELYERLMNHPQKEKMMAIYRAFSDRMYDAGTLESVRTLKRDKGLTSAPVTILEGRYFPHQLTDEAKKIITPDINYTSQSGKYAPEHLGKKAHFGHKRTFNTIEEGEKWFKETFPGNGSMYKTDVAEVYLSRCIASNNLVHSQDTSDFLLSSGLCRRKRILKKDGSVDVDAVHFVIDYLKPNENIYINFYDVEKRIRRETQELINTFGTIDDKYKYLKEHAPKDLSKYLDDVNSHFGLTAGQKDKVYNTLIYEIERRSSLKSFGIDENLWGANAMYYKLDIDKDADYIVQRISNRIAPSLYSMQDDVVNVINQYTREQQYYLSNSMLKLYDTVQSQWKLMNTVVNPGFHIQNAVSNAFQSFLAVGFDGMNPAKIKRAHTILRTGDPNQTIKLGGEVYTYAKLKYMAENYGVLENTFFNKEIAGNMNKFFLYNFGTVVGTEIEGVGRFNLFMSFLDKGKTPEEAVEGVNKFLFDYGDLTDFEQQVLKRIIPFYSFMRKNFPLMLEQMLEQPQTFKTMERAIDNIGMMAGDDYIPDTDRSEWREGSIQIPFKIDGTTYGIADQMPYNQIERLVSPRKLIGQTSPLIKTPIEAMLGEYIYTGMPIESPLDYLANQVTYSKIGNIAMNNKDEGTSRNMYILGQLTGFPLNEIKSYKKGEGN